jgi:DNA polymerase-4
MKNRIILHIDFNSFFASVEQQANPFLRGKAIAVAGKGKHSIDLSARPRLRVADQQLKRTVVTTASREAKRMGVKTAMSSLEARRICPELIIVPGDSRKYSTVTRTFLDILKKHSHLVEQFSTDEGFADITEASGGDMLGATFVAEQIRSEIKERCGEACTASIGIASSKVMAKLASESRKPNGLTVLSKDDLIPFLDRMKLGDACGIGPRIERKLNKLGILTFKGLRNVPLHRLVQEFKSYGYFLHELAHGRGSSVILEEEAPKSVGHSYTFPFDIETRDDLYRQLLALSDRVMYRLSKQEAHATAVSAYLRFGDMRGHGGSRKLKSPLLDGKELARNAMRIFDEYKGRLPSVRLVGVSVSDLIFSPEPRRLLADDEKRLMARKAVEEINRRYGYGACIRSEVLPVKLKERTSGWHYDHEEL